MNSWADNDVDNSRNNSFGENFLTLHDVKYLVEGLEVLLRTNLDGEKRSNVIQLRDKLIRYSSSLINDFN